MNITKAVFLASYNQSFDAIRNSEEVTKRELKALSRSLLSALHGLDDKLLTGCLDYINKLLPVLTPMNKQLAIKYFVAHTGYRYDEALAVFKNKNDKLYKEACDKAIALLADPNQNIYTWAEREGVKVTQEPAPFDPAKVSVFITNQIKKAGKEGKDQLDVMRAVVAAGITPQVLMLLMTEMAQKEQAPQYEEAQF